MARRCSSQSPVCEQNMQKWFRPAKGQFQIYYRLGAEQPEYVPDFVVEAEARNYLVETKARGDMQDPEVLAKAEEVLGEEDDVDADEGDPEMHLADGFMYRCYAR